MSRCRRRRHDGLGRQPRNRDPVDAGRGCELAEHDAQRMIPDSLVVPEGGEDEAPRLVDAPAEHPECVERRLVGPVDVFEDHDDRRRHLLDGRASDGAWVATGAQDPLPGDRPSARRGR